MGTRTISNLIAIMNDDLEGYELEVVTRDTFNPDDYDYLSDRQAAIIQSRLNNYIFVMIDTDSYEIAHCSNSLKEIYNCAIYDYDACINYDIPE